MNDKGTSCIVITNIGGQVESHSQPTVYQRDTKPIRQSTNIRIQRDQYRTGSLIGGAQIQIQIQKEAHRYKEISTGSLIWGAPACAAKCLPAEPSSWAAQHAIWTHIKAKTQIQVEIQIRELEVQVCTSPVFTITRVEQWGNKGCACPWNISRHKYNHKYN